MHLHVCGRFLILTKAAANQLFPIYGPFFKRKKGAENKQKPLSGLFYRSISLFLISQAIDFKKDMEYQTCLPKPKKRFYRPVLQRPTKTATSSLMAGSMSSQGPLFRPSSLNSLAYSFASFCIKQSAKIRLCFSSNDA